MSGARRFATLAWLAAILCCAGAGWLFLPRQPAGAVRPRLSIVLVDASASVSRGRSWLAWARAELLAAAEGAAGAGEDLCVLSFADGVATGFPPGEPQRFLAILEGRDGPPYDPGLALPRGATRLADALGAVEALCADATRPAARLRLLGPATYTGASPSGAWARLARAGVRTELRAPPSPEEDDLGLLELVLPRRVEAGAPLVAVARGILRRGTGASRPARLEFEVECAGDVRSVACELARAPASGEFELPVALGPAGFGRNEVRARCRLDGDAWPENDRVQASTLAEGARVLGVLAGADTRATARAWLEPGGRSALPGLQFVFLEPSELAPELHGLSAVVSFDLPPSALPAEVLEAFVRRGGGWLALSGYGFLADWVPGEAEGTLARLLPCEPAREESPPRDVVLLVDGSGSMEGGPFESVRAAALELVAAALPSDRVSLRFFTGRLEAEHLLKERTGSRAEDPGAARRAARDLLALRVPQGTTYLLSALEELQRTAGENETLALLLTDGWEREGLPDPLGTARALASRLRAARVRLVVIAVGEPNLALLAALAEGAEGVRSGATLDDLRATFHRELHGSQLAEGDLPLALAARVPGSLADEVAGADVERALPSLERFVRNRLRPGGEALWVSAEGEPVLALARVSLGRTALFASRPGAPWARRFVRAGLGEPAEFEGLLRWLARGPSGDGGLRAEIRAGRLVVSGLAEGAPAILPARRVSSRPGSTGIRLFPPAGPGGDVLRSREALLEGEWTPGDLLLVGAGPAPEVVSVQAGPADEFAWREPDARPLSVPSEAPGAGVGSRGSHPLALPAVALALGLLFGAGLAASRGQGLRAPGR